MISKTKYIWQVGVPLFQPLHILHPITKI